MNRKLRTVFLLVAACLVLVWCIPSVGQVLKGSISGTVQDPQGAVVSGAQVKATNSSTGVTLTTTSDSAGLFRVNLIPAGEYKVEVAAQGFKTAVQSNILVAAGRDSSLGSMKLTVGETSTTIEVSGAAPLIETTQSQVTNTFSGTALTSFAGIQENQGLDNLALFVPGVVSVRDNSFSNTNGGQGFSSNGLRGRNNDQEIDGQNNNDNSVAGPGLFLSDTEFVQQYVLITNQFGPEYGRNAGSVVNIITKSGTNAWHGSIYENENLSNLNSLNVQQKNFDTDANGNPLTQQPRLNDEFGGFTVGGPIAKNKAFIFGGFDQEIISTKSIFHSDALTPTPTGLAQLAACPGLNPDALAALNHFGPYAISGGNPFPTVDPSTKQFTTQDITDPTGATVLCPGVQFGGVTRILTTPTHNFNFVNRFDYQRGNDNFMARYLFNRGNNFNLDFGDGAAGYPVSVPALSQAILLGWTHNLSSRMVNEARVGFNRLNVDFGGNTIGTVPTADQVGNTVAHVSFNQPGVANLAIGPATNLPQLRIVNTWQAQDNWNYVVGKHTFKAGVNYTFQRSPNIFLPNLNGAYRFGSWSGFLNNTPNRIQVAAGDPTLDFREHDTFLYGGDDWKIGNTLTLNLGLTWSYYGQPANLFNNITVPRESNPATALWANTSTPFTTGNPASPINGQAIPLSARTFPTFPAPKNSWGPAVGFAWNPQGGGILTGNGKTTIRGGYRLLYDPPFYNIYINMSSSAPEVFLQTVPAPRPPMPADITGPSVRSNLGSFIQKGVFDPRQFAVTSLSPNFGPDRVHSWSFGIEREVTKNSAVEARYVGNRGTNLFQTVNGNPDVSGLAAAFPNLVPAGLTPCPANQAVVVAAIGREDCNQGIVRLRNNDGYSDYNGVQVEFRANNLFKQLTVRTGYTFAKTLDNVSEIFSTGAGANTTAFAQNPFNVTTGEHSFSGLDIPHTWTILFTEDLPFFKEQHGLAGHILGGWQLSGNYILASGQRYTPVQAVAAFITDAFGTGGVQTNPFDSYTGGTPTTAAGFINGRGAGFLGNFIGFDSARPFLGNMNAPQTSVGMFAGDACFIFSFTGTDPVCTGDPNQLVSLTAMGRSGCESDPTIPCPFVAVTKDQVRFIANTSIAEATFGTPFGNMPRNLPQDAISNVANVSVMKRLKISERNSFELRFTMLNAFNHPNFTSVDPFVEDAGLQQSFTGFGDPSLTGSAYPGFNGATRRINFGATFRF
jgi:hypothetical protein